MYGISDSEINNYYGRIHKDPAFYTEDDIFGFLDEEYDDDYYEEDDYVKSYFDRRCERLGVRVQQV